MLRYACLLDSYCSNETFSLAWENRVSWSPRSTKQYNTYYIVFIYDNTIIHTRIHTINHIIHTIHRLFMITLFIHTNTIIL